MKKFKDYLKEGASDYATSTQSASTQHNLQSNPVFKIKIRDLESGMEESPRQSKEEKDKIETSDVITAKDSNGKKRTGRVVKIQKDDAGKAVFYEITTKSGEQIKVDASKVTKKDYHGEKSDQPFDSSRSVVESFETYVKKKH